MTRWLIVVLLGLLLAAWLQRQLEVRRLHRKYMAWKRDPSLGRDWQAIKANHDWVKG
jgi:hypothetical protein